MYCTMYGTYIDPQQWQKHLSGNCTCSSSTAVWNVSFDGDRNGVFPRFPTNVLGRMFQAEKRKEKKSQQRVKTVKRRW